MEIIIDQLNNTIASFLWVFTRIGAAIMTMPVIGTRVVQVRVRLILCISLTFMTMFIIDDVPNVDVMSIESLIILTNQFIIGISMGMVLQLVFQVFLLLGEMIAMQSGLGFAVLNDPTTESSVPMMSQFYLLLITYLFFLFDGHLAFMQTLKESFEILPISKHSLNSDVFRHLFTLGSWMFASAFKIALPSITALLMVNIAFGVMTRAAPQLNIFSIGFPITMILGTVILWATIHISSPHFVELYGHNIEFIKQEIIGGVNGS